MIKIDYGDKETLLFSLYDKAEALNSSTSSDMFSFNFLGEKYEITHEQKKIADQIIAIEKEAVANALKYYSTRLDELAEDLKGDIELRIILGQHTLTDFAELTPFLDLLAEKAPELHKQIIHFTVETFRNKDKLMKTPYAQLVMKKFQERTIKPNNRLVIKATTHKVKAVMIERSKVGRKLHDATALARLYNTGGTVTTKNKGKKDKKDIDSVVSLSIQEVKDWTAHIPANTTLTKFDLEVLSCTVTLFEAGNAIVTADMIFRLLTGGKTQEPTQAMRNEIYDALFRLCCTGIVIDAQEEFNAGYNGKKEFRGTLLPCGMVIGDTILNGQLVHDCIKIYDTSPFIEYARAKRQVSNIPLGMRNIPNVNSTTDNMVLLGYLIGAFADMRNPHSPVQPVIRYDTLYAYLGVEDNSKQGIRVKKTRIRKTVRDILTAWKEGGFIKDFHELTEDNKPAKKGTRAAKVRFVLFTQKELQAMRDNEILSLSTGD